MSRDEIEVPREVREFMPEWIEETYLGEWHGARKQYRYGRLHIREYDDKFLVHIDKADPRSDPLGHLIYDAPEILAGLVDGGLHLVKMFADKQTGKDPISVLEMLLKAGASGYITYATVKEIKRHYYYYYRDK